MATPTFYFKKSKGCTQKVQFLLCESFNIHDARSLMLWSEEHGVLRHRSEKAVLSAILSGPPSYQQKQREYGFCS